MVHKVYHKYCQKQCHILWYILKGFQVLKIKLTMDNRNALMLEMCRNIVNLFSINIYILYCMYSSWTNCHKFYPNLCYILWYHFNDFEVHKFKTTVDQVKIILYDIFKDLKFIIIILKFCMYKFFSMYFVLSFIPN